MLYIDTLTVVQYRFDITADIREESPTHVYVFSDKPISNRKLYILVGQHLTYNFIFL